MTGGNNAYNDHENLKVPISVAHACISTMQSRSMYHWTCRQSNCFHVKACFATTLCFASRNTKKLLHRWNTLCLTSRNAAHIYIISTTTTGTISRTTCTKWRYRRWLVSGPIANNVVISTSKYNSNVRWCRCEQQKRNSAIYYWTTIEKQWNFSLCCFWKSSKTEKKIIVVFHKNNIFSAVDTCTIVAAW